MGWWSTKADDDKSSKIGQVLEQTRPYLPEPAFTAFEDMIKTPWTMNHSIVLGTACTASLLIGIRVGRVRPVWRAVTSLQDLSSADIGASAPWMRGTVVAVSDGDTVRFIHRPTIFHSAKKYNKDHRLAIRLCTIDTPETAKFGKPGQALGEEAKENLKSLCLEKSVRVKILQIDQYGRGVAEVVRPGWLWNTYLDEEMIKAGMAEVYQGSGAVYGRLGKEGYLKLTEQAQKKRVGIWGDPNRETAAEYKLRTKGE